MREIKAANAQTTAIYRFDRKDIYIKVSNLAMAQKLIQQVIEKGGKVEQGRSWMKVNIFGDNKLIKLGATIIDLELTSEQDVEERLFDFFQGFLKQAGFKVEVIQ